MDDVGILEGSLYDTDPEFWDEEDKEWLCVRFDDGSETHVHVDGWWPEMRGKVGHDFSKFIGNPVVVGANSIGLPIVKPVEEA